MTTIETTSVAPVAMEMHAPSSLSPTPDIIGRAHGAPHAAHTMPDAGPILVGHAVKRHVERLLSVVSECDMATGDTLAHAHEAHDALMKMLGSLEAAH